MSNPYAQKLERAERRLAKIEAQQKRFDANAVPGMFVTGRSGVSQSRLRRLDRQLDKTIDLAKSVTAARSRVKELKAKFDLYERGIINQQGRWIWPPREKKRMRPWSERTRQLRRALLELSLDGLYVLNGYKIEVMAEWNEEEKELLGLVIVTSPDGEQERFRAASIQGVHLEATEREVILAILEAS